MSPPALLTPAQAPGAPRQPASILLADGAADAADIAALLVQAGARCDRVGDGALAIAAVAAVHYDAVMMALDMPVLDGAAAAPVLRAIGFTGPIIALAAAVAGPGRPGAGLVAHGAFSLTLDKPHDPGLLDELVQQALRHTARGGASGPVGIAGGSFAGDERTGSSRSGARTTPLHDSDTGFENLPAFAGFRSNFRAALGARLLELRSAAAAADWNTVARQAHTLKGSGGTFGFPGVSECATAIELAALAGNAAAVELALGRLQTHAVLLNQPQRQ